MDMKIGKRIGICFFVFALLLTVFSLNKKEAQAASTANFSVNGGGSVNQGDTVTLTVSVSGSENMSYAKVSLNYTSGILEYQSGADSGGSGRVSILFDCGEGAKSASRKITFKAVATGNASATLDTAEATTMGSAAVLPEMMAANIGGGASITVEAPKSASGDAHIGHMEVSPGTLNPSFNPDTFQYTMEVENNVKKVTVSATASHPAAKITSVKGGDNLKVGKNTITVVCTAENGGTASYTITVTRKAAAAAEEPTAAQAPEEETPEEPEETAGEELAYDLNGMTCYIGQEFKDSEIPEGFQAAEINYQGQSVKGAQFINNNEVQLIYLLDSEKQNGQFFIYHSATGQASEMIKLSFYEGAYLYVLDPEKAGIALPEGLMETEFQIDDRTLRGYVLAAPKIGIGEQNPEAEYNLEQASAVLDQFVIISGVNQNGLVGWYSYDMQEKTLQRFVLFESEAEGEEEEAVEAVSEETREIKRLNERIKAYQVLLFGAAAIILCFLILSILLAVKGRKGKQEEPEEVLEEEPEAEGLKFERLSEEKTEDKTKKEKSMAESSETTERKRESVPAASQPEEVPKKKEAPKEKAAPNKKETPKEKKAAPDKKEAPKEKKEPAKEASASSKNKEDDLGLEFFDIDDL